MWFFDTPETPGGASIVQRNFFESKQPLWPGLYFMSKPNGTPCKFHLNCLEHSICISLIKPKKWWLIAINSTIIDVQFSLNYPPTLSGLVCFSLEPPSPLKIWHHLCTFPKGSCRYAGALSQKQWNESVCWFKVLRPRGCSKTMWTRWAHLMSTSWGRWLVKCPRLST